MKQSLKLAFLIGLGITSFQPAALRAQVARGDQWLSKPVDHKTFEGFLDFFVYDANVPFDTRLEEVVEKDGVRREHITFQSTPGIRVSAYYYRTAVPGGERRPTVVFLHGGVGSGKDSNEPLSTQFVRGGLNVLAIDMLYFGKRKTDLLNTFNEQEKHEKLYNQPALFLSWVAQTVKDAGRSYDFLVKERGADPKRIGLVGLSRGGQVGFIVAGAEKRFAAALLMYAGHFDRFETGHRAAACPANYIGRISPRPLYLINGEFDSDYVKDVSVVPLHRLAGKPKTIIWAQTGHQAPPPEQLAAAIAWLRDKLSR